MTILTVGQVNFFMKELEMVSPELEWGKNDCCHEY